jgi:hypothetical protein
MRRNALHARADWNIYSNRSSALSALLSSQLTVASECRNGLLSQTSSARSYRWANRDAAGVRVGLFEIAAEASVVLTPLPEIDIVRVARGRSSHKTQGVRDVG